MIQRTGTRARLWSLLLLTILLVPDSYLSAQKTRKIEILNADITASSSGMRVP